MMQMENQPKKKLFFLRNLINPFMQSRLFPFLWFGQLISILGSSITTVILPIVVYSLTGSTTTMGLMMAVYILPYVLMLPLSGWVVDRYDRIMIMLLTDLIRFIIMLCIAYLLFANQLSIGVLFGLIGVYGLMDGLFQPAFYALRAVIFTSQIRNAANALTQMSNQAARIIGPSLGGILISFVSIGYGFGLDALTFLVSFICISFLRNKMPNKVGQIANTYRPWIKDFVEGFAILKSHSWLWMTISAFAFFNICFRGVIIILIPWLYKIHLHLDPFIYGFGVSCTAGGSFIAAIIFGSRSKWHHRGLLAYGGAIFGGISLLLMPFFTSVAMLSVLMAFQGFGIMIFSLIWETSLQELVPEEAFGRVVSLDILGSYMLLPFGYLLIGWLADQIGGTNTILIFAGSCIMILASVLIIPSIRKFQ